MGLVALLSVSHSLVLLSMNNPLTDAISDLRMMSYSRLPRSPESGSETERLNPAAIGEQLRDIVNVVVLDAIPFCLCRLPVPAPADGDAKVQERADLVVGDGVVLHEIGRFGRNKIDLTELNLVPRHIFDDVADDLAAMATGFHADARCTEMGEPAILPPAIHGADKAHGGVWFLAPVADYTAGALEIPYGVGTEHPKGVFEIVQGMRRIGADKQLLARRCFAGG